MLGEADPSESTERGTLLTGRRKFREDFPKEMITELILKEEHKLVR